ncbi:MAG: YgiQ family radical SAM protein, partial [Bacteroidetes bacterium]
QDFTPTPMTVATVAYYSGYHPYSLKKVYTAKNKNEKLEQHRHFFWYKPENFQWIKKVLKDQPVLLKKLLERKRSER